PGEALYARVYDAIRCANAGSHSEEQLRSAFGDVWFHALDWVAAHHGFTGAMLDAGWREMATLEVDRPMQGYGDLNVLTDLPLRRFLVTSGLRRLQTSKIRAIGVENSFDVVVVVWLVDPKRMGWLGICRH